ncbi:MAG: metallophosphoesterase [Candidatus Binatia bacterium]
MVSSAFLQRLHRLASSWYFFPTMKCLLVSDLHYALKQFDWVLQEAEAFDVVVIAGDHLDISSSVTVPAQITVILTYLKRLHGKTRLLVCSGNHDLNARNPAGEKFAKWITKVREFGIPTDDDHFEIDDTLFTICPWWDGPQTREKVGAQLARDAKKSKQQWIWVYHAPPDASPTSWGGQKHIGDTDLVTWIQQYQPNIVLTGHIHQSPFRQDGSWVDQIGSTWIFNPGRQIGPCPTHVVFDTNERTALWFSLAGPEVVHLDRPLSYPISRLTELPSWVK